MGALEADILPIVLSMNNSNPYILPETDSIIQQGIIDAKQKKIWFYLILGFTQLAYFFVGCLYTDSQLNLIIRLWSLRHHQDIITIASIPVI